MIELKQLTSVRGNETVIDRLDLKLYNGRCYGLLGVSGVGKSTLAELLVGSLRPASGTVKINGFDMLREPQQAKACLGFLPQELPLCNGLTPFEYLGFIAEAKGLSALRAARQIHEVLELTGADGVKDRLIGKLSPSHRVRLGIAQALLGKPEILVLDDPLSGLDARQADAIGELISFLREDKTVILISPRLEEIRALCDHVLLLSDRTIVENAPLDELDMHAFSAVYAQLQDVAEPSDAHSRRASEPERDGEYELIDMEKEDRQ